MLLTGLLMIVAAFLVAFVVTDMVRRRAQRLGHLEAVTDRSSHEVPTPSSGGLGIAAGGVVASLAVAVFLETVAIPVAIASVIMALIGWWDDRHPIAARWRLGAQILLMGLVVAVLPLHLLPPVLGYAVPEPLAVTALVLAGALWINLFNFMDGIDGLAASEAIFLLVGAALLPVLVSPAPLVHPVFWWMLATAAATSGFLALNWPPAKIFMGDAGSTWLGLMLAFFGCVGLLIGWLTVPQLLILPALFVADAITTLLRRLLQGETLHEAHRRHAYQLLAQRAGAHRPVTLGYMAVNVLLLLPLAVLAGAIGSPGWFVALAVYTVLVPLALVIGAGAPLHPQIDEEGAEADDRQ